MKVSKCNETVTHATGLSWDEMVKQEGVYKEAGPYNHAERIIIVKHPAGKVGSLALWYGFGRLEPASTCQLNKRFIRTNEQVCFEVK